MTDPKEVADLAARLKPRFVIDEPVGAAIMVLSFNTEWEPVVKALKRFLVENNALKSEADTTLKTLSSELERVKGERDAARSALASIQAKGE